jgi:hypothetical protein
MLSRHPLYIDSTEYSALPKQGIARLKATRTVGTLALDPACAQLHKGLSVWRKILRVWHVLC